LIKRMRFMKHLFYFFALTILSSCNSEKKEDKNAVISTPGGLEGLRKGTNTTTATAQTTGKTLIFNPKHGEPGHTCDLAEGAPLNQAATTPAQKPAAQTQPIAVNLPATSTETSSGKNLNPKHGEPGHRCDIAVGAPLDSKPVQAAQSPTGKPVVSQTINTKAAKGMNPPHGQPNHRCDIAVGAPLTSEGVQPATTVTTPPTTIAPATVKTAENQTGG